MNWQVTKFTYDVHEVHLVTKLCDVSYQNSSLIPIIWLLSIPGQLRWCIHYSRLVLKLRLVLTLEYPIFLCNLYGFLWVVIKVRLTLVGSKGTQLKLKVRTKAKQLGYTCNICQYTTELCMDFFLHCWCLNNIPCVFFVSIQSSKFK